jgi:hypothetical protein
MFKVRIVVAGLCFLSVATCALWAMPKATVKCDRAYIACLDYCEQNLPQSLLCPENCIKAYDACYKKAGFRVPSAQLQPTGSPAPSPKGLRPQGTLTQASPTATPKKLQPQGTLTRASPAPTPKKSPTTTTIQKKKKGKK